MTTYGAGGPREGRRVRAVIPGGSSVPILTEAELDVALDFDSVMKAKPAAAKGKYL